MRLEGPTKYLIVIEVNEESEMVCYEINLGPKGLLLN